MTDSPGKAESVLRSGQGEDLLASVQGDRILLKAQGRESNGSVAFAVYTSMPGQPGPPPHWHHGHEEAFFVIEGTLSMLVGDTAVRVGIGDFALAPRTVPHTFWNESDEPCRFVATFTPAGFENVFWQFQRLVDRGASSAEIKDLPGQFDTVLVPWPEGTRPPIR